MNVLRELILMGFLEFEVVYSALQSVERKIQIIRELHENIATVLG